LNKKTYSIPIGPVHPSLEEPMTFNFEIYGERIEKVNLAPGDNHRGIEFMGRQRNPIQIIYLAERICGICSASHPFAFCMAVEKAAGIEVPERGQYIRTIIAELERIHSHFLWLGVAAHEGGFDTLFMYSWRDREVVMDLLEYISGSRVNYSANVIGGVKIDIDEKMADSIRKGIDFLEERSHYYMKVVTTDDTFVGRTRGIGIISKEKSELLGSVGPVARASGVRRDIRCENPYAAYKEFPVEMKTDDAGDLEARFIVRIKELYESYRLIHAILDKMPSGDLSVRVKRRIPEGEVIYRVEAPRGELFYYIKSNGSENPERVKLRTPSLCNWASISDVAVGLKLADMPMLLVGIDPCFSCNDRSIIVNQAKSPQKFMRWEDLRKYGIEYYR